MAKYSPHIFTDIDSITKINKDLFKEFINTFPFISKNCDIDFSKDDLDYKKITDFFMKPQLFSDNEAERKKIMSALHQISEMSKQDLTDQLLVEAKENNITIPINLSSASTATYFYLHHKTIFTTLYVKRKVKNFRSFAFFWGGAGKAVSCINIDEDEKGLLEGEVGAWLGKHQRSKECSITIYPNGHIINIIIQYGKQMVSERQMINGKSEPIFYYPECHDLLIYNSNRDDISIRTEGKLKGREEEYLRYIGKYLFKDEEYFSIQKKFNLDRLRQVQSVSHDFAITHGIEDVTITELHFFYAGEQEIRKSSNLINRLVQKNKAYNTNKEEGKTLEEKITMGNFAITFEDHDKPRKLSLISNENKAIFGRDDDGAFVEDWIHDQGFTTKHPLSKDN